MNYKALEKLEFNKIREILYNFAITYIGKNLANELMPLHTKKRNLKSSSSNK